MNMSHLSSQTSPGGRTRGDTVGGAAFGRRPWEPGGPQDLLGLANGAKWQARKDNPPTVEHNVEHNVDHDVEL